ncbi:hypothetical protein ACYOEI_24585 [Singulisphaera rosea]
MALAVHADLVDREKVTGKVADLLNQVVAEADNRCDDGESSRGVEPGTPRHGLCRGSGDNGDVNDLVGLN